MEPAETPEPRRSLLRRFLWPVLFLAPFGLLSLLGFVMRRHELFLEHDITVQMFSSLALILGVLLTFFWFLFFSGFSGRLRLATGLAVVAGVLFLIFATTKLEFDGNMTPQLTFFWQKTGDQRFQDYLQQKKETSELAVLTVGPTDSPLYRGKAGDGQATHLKLNLDWTAAPPKLLWKHAVGIGHGGISVVGNSAITLEQRGDDEAIVCYDRATGQERWVHSYPARFRQSEPMGGDGPRTSPLIHEGNVIALGATGLLTCVDGSNGKRRWQANILEDAKADNIDWGMAGSPVLIGNVVVVNPGTNKDRSATGSVAGYDLSTGKKLWASANRTSGYASPMEAKIAGQRQAVVFDALALGGFDPQSGAELWKFDWKTEMNMNSAQPVQVGEDQFYIASEKANGGALIRVQKSGDKWQATEVWKNRALCARYCNPVLVNGHLYGLSDGRLVCVEAKTGKRKWAEGAFGNGQLVMTQNALIITSETGKVVLVEPDPAEFKKLGEIEVFDARTWNVPTIAGNQLFVRNHREMAVYELAESK